jgi:hypothetical protein
MKIDSMSKSRRLWLPVAIAIGLLGAAPAPAGTIDFGIQNVSVAAPSSGDSLEVFLTNNTAGTVVIDAFTFGLTEATNTINFTSATVATVLHTYIFAGVGNSFDVSFNGGVVSDTAGAGFLTGGDLWFGAGNGFSVGTGVTVGLGEVFFNVPSGAAGRYTVSFVAGQTSLSDSTGQPIAIGNENSGTITTPASSVPEPSTLTLFGLAIGLLVWARKPLVGHGALGG